MSDWRGKRHIAVRIGQLDMTSTDAALIGEREQTHLEISQWADDNSHRWVIATLDARSEYPAWQHCGDRPLKPSVNKRHLISLMIAGQKLARFLTAPSREVK
jgi:hypothetical protein